MEAASHIFTALYNTNRADAVRRERWIQFQLLIQNIIVVIQTQQHYI